MNLKTNNFRSQVLDQTRQSVLFYTPQFFFIFLRLSIFLEVYLRIFHSKSLRNLVRATNIQGESILIEIKRGVIAADVLYVYK